MSEPESPQGERAGWVAACPLADIPEGGAVGVELEGQPVCLVRAKGADRVYAVQDVCSHAEIPLSEGEVEDTTVECWLHGSRFDLTTGDPIGPPATEPVPVYETKIEDGTVCVHLAGSAGDVLES